MTFPPFLFDDKHYMQTDGVYFFMVWLRFNYLTTSVFIFCLLTIIKNNKWDREREKTENNKSEKHWKERWRVREMQLKLPAVSMQFLTVACEWRFWFPCAIPCDSIFCTNHMCLPIPYMWNTDLVQLNRAGIIFICSTYHKIEALSETGLNKHVWVHGITPNSLNFAIGAALSCSGREN